MDWDNMILIHRKTKNTSLTPKHCLKITQKVAFFKNSPKLTILGIFNELLSTQNVCVANFARNVDWDFFYDFQTLCVFNLQKEDQSKGSLKLMSFFDFYFNDNFTFFPFFKQFFKNFFGHTTFFLCQRTT